MAEYIKRSDAMKICREYSSHCFTTNDASGQDIADRIEDDIVKLPTTDVEEVKHGAWTDTGDKQLDTVYSGWKCSECGYIFCGCKTNYCGECGAIMDGERRDEECIK